jgi:hypothetical protein
MTLVTLGPCNFVFEVEVFVGAAALNGGLAANVEDCIRRLFRDIRNNGRTVDLEYMTDGICIFEECNVFIHVKREPRVISVLRIEAI